MNQEKIGEYIRKLRKENNLSQKEFADKLCVTFQAVSKWENGKNLPDMSTLKEISNLFNVGIDEIINGGVKDKCNCGNKSHRKFNYIYIGLFILLVIIIIVCGFYIYFRSNKDNYKIDEVHTNNQDFNISGTVVRTDNRTSLIINNVDYTGNDSSLVYKKLKCTLYEEKNNVKTKINSCDSGSNETLVSYLKNVKVRMDHQVANCPMFSKSKLVLEIVVVSGDNKNITYELPIMIEEDCK